MNTLCSFLLVDAIKLIDIWSPYIEFPLLSVVSNVVRAQVYFIFSLETVSRSAITIYIYLYNSTLRFWKRCPCIVNVGNENTRLRNAKRTKKTKLKKII